MVPDVLIVGAGIFGVTAALSLRQRGQNVTLVDPGPLPHPLAASTDISKVVRMEYGADDQYMAMVEQAIEGWHDWNAVLAQPLYHETGVLMVSRNPWAPGGYEYESYARLLARGHRPERLDAAEIVRRFPAFRPGAYADGFFHARGGFAESGRVVTMLLARARAAGVTLKAGKRVVELQSQDGAVTGVHTDDGDWLAAGHVLLAAGAWTPLLLPELAGVMGATGHPVFHLRPDRPARFQAPSLPVFTADVSRTGWYGFPLHPGEKVLKIGRHSAGLRLHPRDDERVVSAADEASLREFLADTFPELAAAPVTYTRRCLYCDTRDEHFWIDRHPTIQGLTVAAGGSGHGFKFAPILGDLIAAAVLGDPHPWRDRFCWRTFTHETTGVEAARHHSDA